MEKNNKEKAEQDREKIINSYIDYFNVHPELVKKFEELFYGDNPPPEVPAFTDLIDEFFYIYDVFKWKERELLRKQNPFFGDSTYYLADLNKCDLQDEAKRCLEGICITLREQGVTSDLYKKLITVSRAELRYRAANLKALDFFERIEKILEGGQNPGEVQVPKEDDKAILYTPEYTRAMHADKLMLDRARFVKDGPLKRLWQKHSGNRKRVALPCNELAEALLDVVSQMEKGNREIVLQNFPGGITEESVFNNYHKTEKQKRG